MIAANYPISRSNTETSLKNNTDKVLIVPVLYFKAYAKTNYTSGKPQLCKRATFLH
jgi:hypothetical protein